MSWPPLSRCRRERKEGNEREKDDGRREKLRNKGEGARRSVDGGIAAGGARHDVEGGGGRREGRRVGGWPDGGEGGRRATEEEGNRGSREKDIKVRNSQRGERAPPRHRLDRGSLIPLLECSPLLFLLRHL